MPRSTTTVSAEDQAQILSLLTTYAFSLDRRDFSSVASVFTEDAEI